MPSGRGVSRGTLSAGDPRAWGRRGTTSSVQSAFVLISNLPEEEWSDAALLEEYKGQTKVEQGFRVYKHPIVDDGIFLKSTRRVEAFAYVATLALMVAAFLEYRVRQELQKTETKKLRLIRGQRVTDSPTSLALLEEIDYIPVLGQLTSEGYSRYADVADDIPEEHLEILRLAGFGPEIYFEPLVSN